MPVLKELETAVLTQDLPDQGLRAGDMGVVVHVHRNGEAYEIEFMTLTGGTIDVVTVTAAQVRPVAEAEISHARKLAG